MDYDEEHRLPRWVANALLQRGAMTGRRGASRHQCRGHGNISIWGLGPSLNQHRHPARFLMTLSMFSQGRQESKIQAVEHSFDNTVGSINDATKVKACFFKMYFACAGYVFFP